MRFGQFEDVSREYVITTPRTPYPWINYLGTEQFFGLISHTGGGYCFYRDARLRRLTRYRYNNVPTDTGGRYYYVHDAGDYWTPGWAPVKRELDFYECRVGLSYTKITGERGGLRAEVLYFVPLGTTAEVEVAGPEIYHKTEYRERRDHYAVYAVNAQVAGFDTDRESFLGPWNGFGEPAVVAEGKSRNSVASGWSPIGSHQLDVELAPLEARTFIFVLGYVENPVANKWEKPGVVNKQPARELLARFQTTSQVDAALVALRDYWSDLLARYTCLL